MNAYCILIPSNTVFHYTYCLGNTVLQYCLPKLYIQRNTVLKLRIKEISIILKRNQLRFLNFANLLRLSIIKSIWEIKRIIPFKTEKKAVLANRLRPYLPQSPLILFYIYTPKNKAQPPFQ